ncbi:hypothetical protein MASR2M117_04810 [Paludibacter sp.]
MKKIVYLLFVGMLTVSSVNLVHSQPRGKFANKPGVAAQQKPNQNAPVTPEKRAEFLAKQLELSDAEKAKVQALFEKQDVKIKQRQEQMQKLREEHLATMETERKANEAELIKIIGNEKFQKMQAQKISRLERINKRGRRGGMPAPNPNCPYYYNCPRK